MKSQMDSHDVTNRPPSSNGDSAGVQQPEPQAAGDEQAPVEGAAIPASGVYRGGTATPQAGQVSQQGYGQQPYQQPYEQQQGYAGAPYGQQQSYQQQTYQQPYPLQPAAKKESTLLKVVALVFAGFLGTTTLVGVLMVAGLSMAIASCEASCSDNPIGDSRENARFISATEANELDLATFDALYGCLDSLYEVEATYSDDVTSVDDIRAALEAGAWPKLEGYGEIDSPRNPQAWVRIAELSAQYIGDETGEQWEVMDFAYPFPDNGPVPAPAVRDENDYTSTRVLCTNGKDKGLVTEVLYYRWAQDAYFTSMIEDSREIRDGKQAAYEQLRKNESLAGRQFMKDGMQLDVWSTGEDDPLRDPETFVALANELNEEFKGLRISLLVEDTPFVLCYDSLGYDYPNERDQMVVSFDEGCKMLEQSGGSYYFDYAAADRLLSLFVYEDDTATTDDLEGMLASNDATDYGNRWYPPKEGSAWSGELCDATASEFGCDASQVIAAAAVDDHEDRETTVNAWVVVPRGVLPETPDEFCDAANRLRDTAWNLLSPVEDGHERHYFYLRIYVVDETSITADGGEEASFEDMRSAAESDPTLLENYEVDLLLAARPSASLWEGDSTLSRYDVSKDDVGGGIALSREWRFGANI